jgi:antitoxin component YwqK of YwqJK toxin-antitoxin module
MWQHGGPRNPGVFTMHHRLALLLSLCLVQTALAVQDCELNGESVNPANGNTTQDKTGLMRCHDRDSGQVVREQELKAGRFVGLVRYYKDGKLEREYSVNDKGNRDGRSREFLADGRVVRVVREETYSNGSVIGTSRSWHANGTLKRIAARSDKDAEAAFAEFNEQGQLKGLHCAERPMLGKEVDDGSLCGHSAREPVTRELYSDAGVVRGRVSHLAGERVAAESLWDNGKPQEQQESGHGYWLERNFSREGIKRHETRWVAGVHGRVKQAEQEYHENGSLVRERRWAAGELVRDKSYFLNGQVKSDHRHAKREGQAVCDAIAYHDNGKPMSQGVFLVRNGYLDKPVGNHSGYDAEGRLRSEREYDDAGRLTRERELDEGGRVLRDDAVFEDGSRKAFAAPAR